MSISSDNKDKILDTLYTHVKVNHNAVKEIMKGFPKGQNIADTCRIKRRKDKDFPKASYFYKLVMKDKSIAELFKTGRDSYYLALEEKLLEISNEEPDDDILEMENRVALQAFEAKKKRQIDVIKFALAKIASKDSNRYKTLDETKYEEMKEHGVLTDNSSNGGVNIVFTNFTDVQNSINKDQIDNGNIIDGEVIKDE